MAYRSSQNAQSSVGVTSIDVTAPAGVATGDAVVCSSAVDANSTATTLPTGASALASSPQTSTFDAQRHACGVKYESGTPPATYTFAFDASIECVAVVAAYSGVDSTPLHTSSGNASSSGSGSPRAIDASTITTTVSCDLVWVGSADWGSGGNSPAYTPPTSYNERQDLYNGSFCSISLADQESVLATTTGTVTGTGTASSGSAGFTAFLIALKLSAAAAQKITELSLATPTIDDLLAIVDNPAGTPASKKGTLAAVFAGFLGSIVVQTKTVGSGTYTPTTGMVKVLVIGVGGGAGGRSATATDEAGGGGGAGGTCVRLLTAAQIGASKAYVTGAKGAANSAGTATTLDTAGALLNAGGGAAGSVTGTSTTTGVQAAGGAGGAAANGDLNVPGQQGGRGLIFDGTNGIGGYGGRSVFGGGSAMTGANGVGSNGTAYGSGGAGGHASGATDKAGGQGADGILYFIEFLGL